MFLFVLHVLVSLGFCFSHQNLKRPLSAIYVDEWKKFYPSKAYRRGFHASIYDMEDYSTASIRNWIAFNESVLSSLSKETGEKPLSKEINERLLRSQIHSELVQWKEKEKFKSSLTLYSSVLANSLSNVLNARFLNASEKNEIICSRFDLIIQLIQNSKENLKRGSTQELHRGIAQLKRFREYVISEISNYEQSSLIEITCFDFQLKKIRLMDAIDDLVVFVTDQILPYGTDESRILGQKEYASALKQYIGFELTPDQLAEMALAEIKSVKSLITKKSESYVLQRYPDQSLPVNDGEIIDLAFADMEKDAPGNGTEYLAFWENLADASLAFLKERDIMTIPEENYLSIRPAPESAGSAARIGWVDVAPPFTPNPWTTLYLPSIPDTLDTQEQIDFWSSFNKPFNRMIVIHELIPGHYMQNLIARKNPHAVRLLFPYGPYSEGWATFCEMVALDEGWESERPLTYLAHLRKRLENANRAYTSVMAHCQEWNEEDVYQFSIEQSLLAPQFAKSLWGRLMRSPMQMTSYFFGGVQFRELYKNEKERLGDRFQLKEFMDTILKSGPIAIDDFYQIFERSKG